MLSSLCYKLDRHLCVFAALQALVGLGSLSAIPAAHIEISEFMEILHQLGSLIVGAIPTMILFILLVMANSLLVRRPLDRMRAERRARTTGAVEQARGAIAAAEAEVGLRW